MSPKIITSPLTIKISILSLFALLCFAQAQADTIYLKNGSSQEGIIKSEGSGFVEVEVNGGVVKFPKAEVSWIVKSSDGVRRQLRQNWGQNNPGTEKNSSAQKLMGDSSPKQAEFTRGQQGMTVNAVINGKVNVKLILDTGASLIVLRKGLAKDLGIDPANIKSDMNTILADGSHSGAKHIVLRSVKVQDSEVENVDAAILVDDIKDYPGDGLLGESFLKNFNFKIDQKENKLVLEKIR